MWLQAKKGIARWMSTRIPTHFFVGMYADKKIEFLGRYPSIETYNGLHGALLRGFEVFKTEDFQFWQKDHIPEADLTIIWITRALQNVATENELETLEADYATGLEIVREKYPHIAHFIEREWNRAKRVIKVRRKTLPSLEDPNYYELKADLYVNPNSVPAFIPAPTAPRLKKADKKNSGPGVGATGLNVDSTILERSLRENIVEQDETIARILDIELRFEIYGSKNPETEPLLLMGMPGGGKDTSAENWVDGVYGYEGAWQEHLFRMDPASKVAEAWSILGSSTGYVGSKNLSPYIRYLVEHSCGKYKIKSSGGFGSEASESVVENEEWKGEPIPGVPCRAFVFVNEWHDWAKKSTNIVLKEALEKGLFKINNPNGGLKQLQIPGVVFILAANYGIERLASRELNGTRIGKPLLYSESLARWERFKDNKVAIKKSILSANGGANSPDRSEDAKGVSEEFLNRIGNSRMVVQKPISPEGLRRVVRIRLDKLRKRLASAEGRYGAIDFDFSDEVVNFIQSYHYNAEENARPMKDKVNTLIEAPINELIKEGKFTDVRKSSFWRVGLLKYENGTHGLRFIERSPAPGQEARRIDKVIEYTLADKTREPISDTEIDHILASGERMKESVIASGNLIHSIVTSMLSAREQSYEPEDKVAPKNKAHVFMFLGPSSTGKTQLAKAATQANTGSAEDLKIIDFSSVQTVEDLKHKVLGSKTPMGDPTPSEFMKEYDRRGGEAYFAFDEFSNAPQSVHMALYDILREPEVRTFSDNDPRRMGNVHIFITGNCGQEWYQDIPKQLPMLMQMYAMEKIYNDAMASPGFLQETLAKCFPNPLTARVDKIVFFSPFAFKELRELTQLKVVQVFKDFLPREGRRGWKIGFRSEADYLAFLTDIEEHGFTLKDQGAAVDRYVQNIFRNALRTLLLENKVPSGSTLFLERRGLQTNDGVQQELNYDVVVEGSSTILPLSLPAQDIERTPTESPEQQAMTAAHEAGHEIMRKFAFGAKYASRKISIIQGVQRIANQMVVYRGIAESTREEDFAYTFQAVIDELSVMHAGYLAQMLVSKNRFHDAGKQNDLQRASAFARRAILEFGLSPKWGSQGIPQGMKLEDYLASLPEERKKLLFDEEARFMHIAKVRALAVLTRNLSNVLIPMSELLLEKGELLTPDFVEFYARHPISEIDAADIQAAERALSTDERIPELQESASLDPELIDEYKIPARIANISEFARMQKATRVAMVPTSKDIFIADRSPAANQPAILTPFTDCEKKATPPNG